jgi:hypothetical protein
MKTYVPIWAAVGCLAAPLTAVAFCVSSNPEMEKQCEEQEQEQEQRLQQQEQEQEQQQRMQQEEQQQEQQQRMQQEEQQQRMQQQEEQQEQQQRLQEQQQRMQQRERSPRGPNPERPTLAPSRHVPRSPITSPNAVGRGSIAAINSERAKLHGLNRRPLPSGRVFIGAHGQSTLTVRDGRRYLLRSNGTVAAFRDRSQSANFYANGKIRSLHTRTMEIERTALGERMIVFRRPHDVLVVSYGPRSGYVQRTLVYEGRSYMQRSYLINGHVMRRNYREYVYGGFTYYSYVPTYVFAPAYYSWLASPWNVPVEYSWGWNNAPWYAYNSTYFAPYAVYPSPAAWITDYYLAAVLQSAYTSQVSSPSENPTGNDNSNDYSSDAGGDTFSGATAPITPDLKAQIAQDVQNQISSDAATSGEDLGSTAAADGGLESALQPNHIFVVSQPLNVVTDQDQSCSLSPGNVLKLVAPPGNGVPTAEVWVAASHEGDCPETAEVTLTTNDLQEMYNDFRAGIDEASKAIGSGASSNQLPPPPDPQTQVAPGPVPDSENTGALLSDAQVQGNDAEGTLSSSAFTQ